MDTFDYLLVFYEKYSWKYSKFIFLFVSRLIFVYELFFCKILNLKFQGKNNLFVENKF